MGNICKNRYKIEKKSDKIKTSYLSHQVDQNIMMTKLIILKTKIQRLFKNKILPIIKSKQFKAI